MGGWAECGLHWRAGLLQLAKWPYLGLALLDGVRARQPAYEMTPKLRGAPRPRPVVRAHLPVAVLLGLAWLSGAVAGQPRPGLLHLWTAGLVLACVALMATDWWPFPVPYGRRPGRGSPAVKGQPASASEQGPGA